MKTPVLKFGKKVRRIAPPRKPPTPYVKKGVFDIGPGPWFYDGKRASEPEMRVLKVLMDMGFKPKFQVPFLGGRIRGGQVLDIVVDEVYPPVVIDVVGYYHKTALRAAEDLYLLLMLRKYDPNVLLLRIWEEQTERRDQLERLIEGVVGPYGRRTRA